MNTENLPKGLREALDDSKHLSHSIHCSLLEAVENSENVDMARSQAESEMKTVIHQAVDVLVNFCGKDAEGVGMVLSEVVMERF